MNDNVRLTGKCTCGDIQFELKREPMFVHCCHCSWCQRETGSAFAINALVESENVKILTGHPDKVDVPSNSGLGQRIIRCSFCKTALWSNYSAAKETVCFVRVGTLNSPNACPPDIHIFTSTKQNWIELGNSVPAVDEYYQRSKYWPEESIHRYKIAIKA